MRDLVASEWIKLRSVQSTWWAVLAAASSAVAVAAIFSYVTADNWTRYSPGERQGFDPLSASFNGFIFAQLAVATLGVLAITPEYSTGLIRTTFAAAPRRPAVLAAKATVVGTLALVAGEVIAFASYLTAQVLLRPTHTDLPLTSSTGLWGTAGAGLYLAVVALVGLGCGSILRHTAGALTTVFGLLFLVSQLVLALPDPWRWRLARLMPPEAAQQIASLHPNPHLLDKGPALLVLIAWTIVALVAGTVTVHRSDA